MQTTLEDSPETTTATHPASDASARPAGLSRTPDYSIYKPNSRGNGGVFRFSLSKAKAAVFVEAANQSGEKQFDWDQKIIMKWGLSDLGATLAVLQGKQDQAKLFHQSEKANSACDLLRRAEADRAPYLITISRQDAAQKGLRKVMIPLSHSEAAILEIALRNAVSRILGW